MNGKRFQVNLIGCSPTPLAHYLKALGVLRLVSEQADSTATGWWKNDSFWMESNLDEAGFIEFLHDAYIPTPIVVPWSGADFFDVNRQPNVEEHEKAWPVSSSKDRPAGTKIIEAFLANKSPRVSTYIEAIRAIFQAIDLLELKTKDDLNSSIDKSKSRFLVSIRNLVKEELLDWVDVTSIVGDIEANDLSLNCLLGGGGGSDGNSHFSDNFMQCLWLVFRDFDCQRTKSCRTSDGTEFQSKNAIRNSLFGDSLPGVFINKLSPALFNPEAVGGANSGNGFDEVSISNPWDYVLMLEGSLLFAGGASRRLQTSRQTEASFPFLVGVTPTGPGGINEKERTAMSREAWLPLWGQPVKSTELKLLFSEGRIELRNRKSQNGIDVARAIARLGVDRGISEFQRIAILKGRIGGDNYFTTCSLGRFRVKAAPGVEELLAPIDTWLDRFRRVATGKNAPARAGRALRQLESSILDLCQKADTNSVQSTLIALGEAEASVAISNELRNGNMGSGLSPLPLLDIAWLLKSNDGSPEYRLAAALGSVTHGEVGPIRCHLEPIRRDAQNYRSKYPRWADEANDPGLVWESGSLVKNLNNVLLRRLMEASRGEKGAASRMAPLRGYVSASLSDVTAFIDDLVDEQRIEALFKAFCLIEHPKNRDQRIEISRSVHSNDGKSLFNNFPSSAYALLKLCFLPHLLHDEQVVLTPKIARRAVGGDGVEATRLAARRLQSDGFNPAINQVAVSSHESKRTAAALMFPIGTKNAEYLASIVLRPGSNARANQQRIDVDLKANEVNSAELAIDVE